MDTLTIELSSHAIDRFHERVRPSLTRESAEDHLAWLLAHAQIAPEPPAWFARTARQTADAYAVMGDVVLPLVATRGGEVHVAKTCIPRGGISEATRARRNARRGTHQRNVPQKSWA